MPTYSIADWDTLYETSETRKLKTLKWVPIPNKHDGKGFGRLMTQNDPGNLLAAWVLILEVASKMPVRGVLEDADGPLDAEDLHYKTGLATEHFTRALRILSDPEVKICWMLVTNPLESQENLLESPETSSANRIEGNRIEQNRTEVNPRLLTVRTLTEKQEKRRGDSNEEDEKHLHPGWLPGEVEYLIAQMPEAWQSGFSGDPDTGILNLRYNRLLSIDPLRAYQHVLDVVRGDRHPKDAGEAMAFIMARIRDEKVPSDTWLEAAKALKAKFAKKFYKEWGK